jgi:hypothetical protein
LSVGLQFDSFVLVLKKDKRFSEAKMVTVLKKAIDEIFPSNSKWVDETSRALVKAPTDDESMNEILLRVVPKMIETDSVRPMYAILNLKYFSDLLNGSLRDSKYKGVEIFTPATYRTALAALSRVPVSI